MQPSTSYGLSIVWVRRRKPRCEKKAAPAEKPHSRLPRQPSTPCLLKSCFRVMQTDAAHRGRPCKMLHSTLRLLVPVSRSASREAAAKQDGVDEPARHRHTGAVLAGQKSHGVAKGLAVAAAVACQAAFQFGFATGVLNIPQKSITEEIGLPPNGLGWSFVVSIWCLGGLLGAQNAASIADKRGRRALLGLSGAFCAVSGVVMFGAGCVSQSGSDDPSDDRIALGLLIAGRLISGVGCGSFHPAPRRPRRV